MIGNLANFDAVNNTGHSAYGFEIELEDPDLWDDYVPAGTVHFIRLFSPWGDVKVDRLRARGFRVEVLPAPEGKLVSGADVRDALRAGGPWRDLVPPAVARVIDDLPVGHALAPRTAL